MDKTIRLLNANEIDCRVGTCTEKGFSILLYKNARVDMQILDEVYGNLNWQREHKEIKGNLYCGVSIWDEKKAQWITKWDCGVESNTEKEKGESSDSFKRACFNIGIGRERYTAPFIWIDGRVRENGRGGYVPSIQMGNVYVSYIDYDVATREIIKLEIRDKSGVLYSFNMGGNFVAPAPVPQPSAKVIKTEEIKKEMVQPKKVEEITSNEMSLNEAMEVTTFKGRKLGELKQDQLQMIVEKSSDATRRKAAQIILDNWDNLNDFSEIPEDDLGDLPF